MEPNPMITRILFLLRKSRPFKHFPRGIWFMDDEFDEFHDGSSAVRVPGEIDELI